MKTLSLSATLLAVTLLSACQTIATPSVPSFLTSDAKIANIDKHSCERLAWQLKRANKDAKWLRVEKADITDGRVSNVIYNGFQSLAIGVQERERKLVKLEDEIARVTAARTAKSCNV